MLRRWAALAVRVLPLIVLLGTARAQCPGVGLSAHGRCWYLGDAGASCSATCSAQGLAYNFFVADAGQPMIPQLLGRSPGTKQFSWARSECYVPGGDRFHTAKQVADSNAEDAGQPGDWKVSVCRLACPCAVGDPNAPQKAYPDCVQQGIVYRHAGEHAIFADLSAVGATGCWQNDCKNTDKFNAEDRGVCARTCSTLDECTHWTFGEQEGATKCFFRKSDGGREQADGFASAPRSCSPPQLPDAFVAFAASKVVEPCDGGKNPACPDIAKAITTWKFAIKHLKRAAEGKVDGNTLEYINQILADTDAFAAQLSEENFPVITSNNRQVFQVLNGWLQSQPGATLDPNDASLPNPLRGRFCGPSSCYETV
mmetsp:Transcript_59882/g.129831  ORF Transcript_59882/g.129831 Transcript_59882/m.129831 type:complete len:369 (-) Transcript_59882:123-1229(-)